MILLLDRRVARSLCTMASHPRHRPHVPVVKFFNPLGEGVRLRQSRRRRHVRSGRSWRTGARLFLGRKSTAVRLPFGLITRHPLHRRVSDLGLGRAAREVEHSPR